MYQFWNRNFLLFALGNSVLTLLTIYTNFSALFFPVSLLCLFYGVYLGLNWFFDRQNILRSIFVSLLLVLATAIFVSITIVLSFFVLVGNALPAVLEDCLLFGPSTLLLAVAFKRVYQATDLESL